MNIKDRRHAHGKSLNIDTGNLRTGPSIRGCIQSMLDNRPPTKTPTTVEKM
jgi:hypothetical protein